MVNVTLVAEVGYVPLTFKSAAVVVIPVIVALTLLPVSPVSATVGLTENVLPASTVIFLVKETKEAPGVPAAENCVVSIVAPEITSTKIIVIDIVLT